MKRNRWDDHYSITARRERFPARSVYKLKEIQKKYRIIQPGHKILDLGCSPGSWLLYAASQAGPGGEVIGFDLKPVSIQVPPNVSIHTGDILSLDQKLRDLIGNGFNITLSDMAPDTTGNKNVDAARSFALCQSALSFCQDVLLRDGSFVCKIFQGADFEAFLELVKKGFKRYKIFKPQSSRKRSREIYIVALGKK